MFGDSPADLRSGVLLGFFEGRARDRGGGRLRGCRRAARARAELLRREVLRRTRRCTRCEYVEQDWTAEELLRRSCYGGRVGTGVCGPRYARALSKPRRGGSAGPAPSRPPTSGTATWTAPPLRRARGQEALALAQPTLSRDPAAELRLDGTVDVAVDVIRADEVDDAVGLAARRGHGRPVERRRASRVAPRGRSSARWISVSFAAPSGVDEGRRASRLEHDGAAAAVLGQARGRGSWSALGGGEEEARRRDAGRRCPGTVWSSGTLVEAGGRRGATWSP